MPKYISVPMQISNGDQWVKLYLPIETVSVLKLEDWRWDITRADAFPKWYNENTDSDEMSLLHRAGLIDVQWRTAYPTNDQFQFLAEFVFC